MKQATMKEIFEQCQHSMKSHSNLLKIMEKIYDKTDFNEFWPEFNHYMKYPMINFQREPVVERTIDFIAKFVTSVNPDPNTPGPDPDDSLLDEVSQNKLLLEMFEFLLKSHNASSRAVRFRVCQLINKILNNLGDDAQIDDDLYDKIYQCMLERLRDKEPVVRFHAVMALARLQDPKDENCPVIKAYLYLIQSDPNPEVRRAVLTCIAPSPKTLSAILEKTRDIKDTVRKTAYKILGEKVHIKALSIANRERLLQEGLTDRVESVKEACSSKLLQAWLRTFGGNVLELLGALDVEYATETCELVLNPLFKHSSISELIKNFDILDEKILIPQDKLNAESVLYWNMLCKHIHGLGTDYDADLEKVLPNCLEFAKYIKEYVDTLRGCDDIDIQLQKHFVIQQLIAITGYMDLADTVSRKALETLLNYMLTQDHVAFNLVKHIVPRLCQIKDYSESLVIQMAETISEIREPITTVEKDVSDDMRRQNDVKIAGIRVKINQLKEELDESIKSQDFSKAQDIKESIKELDEERDQLLKDNEPQVEEVKSEKTDVVTLLKCQAIVAEMLEALPLKTLNPSLQTLIETLILPGIMNEDAGIRNLAVRSLGLCCLLNKDLVLVHLPLFMQASQIDVEVVRITALKVMIDLLHMHGTEAIKHGSVGQKPADLNTSGDLYEEPDNSEQASKLVAFLTAFLDSQNSELRTIAAEGMAKLMLSGRVISSKILSHLLLLWYNPVTEDDTHLRHCLGTFLPIFAFAGRSNQETVEEAFMPTLKTIVCAPLSSPLAEVNADNVAELLVQLTNTKLLLENQKSEEQVSENPGHDSLSIAICNEILSNPESNSLKLFVRVLNQLELSPTNIVNLKEVAVLTDKLSKVVKDNQCLKTIEKVKNYVKSLLPEETSTMEEESAEKETEGEPERGAGDSMNTTVDRSVLNDTAQQLDGSLFQESRTLKRIKSITSTKSLDSTDIEADVRDLPVFPDIQEEPETPRLIGVKTPSSKKTPAKGLTPAKGQTPAKTLKPKKLAEQENVEKVDTKEKSADEKTGSSSPRGRTPTKRKNTEEEKPSPKGKSPAKGSASNKTPVRKGSPARKESPTKKSNTGNDKSPARGQTPTKRKLVADEKSPVIGKSPRKGSGKLASKKDNTPERSTTPSKRKLAPEGRSPILGKSPRKAPSPRKEASAKDKSTRVQRSSVRSATPSKENSPIRTPTASRMRTQVGKKVESPIRKDTPSKTKTATTVRSKPDSTEKDILATPPLRRGTRGKSPLSTESPAQKSKADASKTAKSKTDSPATKTKTRGAPNKEDIATSSPRRTRTLPSRNSPSPTKTTKSKGKETSVVSDKESPIKSPRGQKRTIPASSEEEVLSTDSSQVSVTRNTRRGIPLSSSSVVSTSRNTRRGKAVSEDDLASTDSTMKSSPKKTKRSLKGGSRATRGGTKPSFDDSEDDTQSTDTSTRSVTRTTRGKAKDSELDSSVASVRSSRVKAGQKSDSDSKVAVVRKNVRTAAKKVMTDEDTDSSVVSNPRAKRIRSSARPVAESDSESSSPTKPSIKSTRKSAKELQTILSDSDLDNTVFNSPTRSTRSGKPSTSSQQQTRQAGKLKEGIRTTSSLRRVARKK